MTAPSTDRKGHGGRPRDPLLSGRVITATTELIAARGPYGFAADDVAATCRIGKASLYRRWRSLDALFVDVVAALGVRESDVVWSEPGTVREDLIALLTAASTGVRARAEVALLSTLPYRPDLREAWRAGPLLRLTQALTMQRNRAHRRGDADQLPSIVRTQAALAWLRVDAAQHGHDPDAETIAGVVTVLLMPPPRPTGPPYPRLAPTEEEWQAHLDTLSPAGDDDHGARVAALTAEPLDVDRLRELAKDAITRRLGYWQANTIVAVVADDDGGLFAELNSGGNALAVGQALTMGNVPHTVEGLRVNVAPPGQADPDAAEREQRRQDREDEKFMDGGLHQ